MATLTIGGKTLATQTGTGEPVLGSNVILSNDSLASATFPTGMVIGSNITFFNEITSYTQAAGSNSGQYQLYAGLDIDDLEVSYTPKFPTSKLIVSGIAYWGVSVSVYSSVRIKRQIDLGTYDFYTDVMNTDVNAMPGTNTHKSIAGYSSAGLNASGWTSFATPFCIVDASHISNVGSTVRYKLNHSYNSNDATTKTLYLNRNYYPSNDYGSFTMVSHIKIEEIAQ